MKHAVESESSSQEQDTLDREWEETYLRPSLERMPETQEEFTTVSLRPIRRLYTPHDIETIDFEREINFPGGVDRKSTRLNSSH